LLADSGQYDLLLSAGRFLGLLTEELGGWYRVQPGETWMVIGPEAMKQHTGDIGAVGARWQGFRAARDFSSADTLKAQMSAIGLDVRATPRGPVINVSNSFDPAKLESLK
jgi:hypothetical protein